jgi:citrate synthase
MTQGTETLPDTLTSDEAAAYLGIKRETLYAYASRGLVKGLPGARGHGRRYRREDLEPLRARSAGPAASALRYGDPVLETRITRMSPEGPEYRGRLATDLVRDGASFETVAELLWTGLLPAVPPRWPGDGPVLRERDLARVLPPGSGPLAVLSLVLPVLATADPLRFDAEPAAVMARARRLIPRLAASFALALDPRRLPAALDTGDPVLALARALGVPEARKPLELLRAALILCADHELNASTFAARVAASTGADLHACLSAAVATFTGPRHGGASEQVEWMVREAGTPARAAATVGDRLRRGERLPGFGHPFYPAGDPRAPPLIERALALAPRSTRLRTVLAVAEAVQATGRPRANIDVAIAAACAALDLPVGLGPALFAVGRSAGWVANVLEQQTSPAVLRPRARFIGEGGDSGDGRGAGTVGGAANRDSGAVGIGAGAMAAKDLPRKGARAAR